MIKRMDVAVYRTIEDYTQRTPGGGERVCDLADAASSTPTSGGFIDGILTELERMKRDIIEGRIVVPTEPVG